MSTRITRLSYSFLTAALLNLAACGGDAEPAKFSTATDLQKQRAVSAGSATDSGLGLIIGMAFTGLPDDSVCPKISRSGSTATITGGCTTESGDKFEGSMTTENVPGLFGGPENDPSKPSVVTYDGFKIDDTSDENDDAEINGKVTLNTDGSLSSDLSLMMGGVMVHTSATFRHNETTGMITADEGAAIEIDGLGAADIKGSWKHDSDAPAGALELHGADVLKADFGATANGCVPLTVDGQAAGQMCESEGDDI